MALVHRLVRYRPLVEHDPTVSVRHDLSLLVQLFFLAREHLGHGELSQFGFGLEHLLLVLESEKFAAVLEQRN